ncbi:hypothetical protein Bhyg_01548 [Pseudolycoriella hygida]|uniref:Uncharacterized protein n=1 Tax=Pseudolycoriella hygida TaxID=35572 RepID=A0A9Q0N9L8_9DIPT|nr:hypothetical protein Bhyg_01548 [Pseudolycoriella hygida]
MPITFSIIRYEGIIERYSATVQYVEATHKILNCKHCWLPATNLDICLKLLAQSRSEIIQSSTQSKRPPRFEVDSSDFCKEVFKLNFFI